MAIRFRKSIKIAPGIRLNVSKSGVSTSIGGRGATVNIGKKGTRVTASIPGTGLSTSHLYKAPKRRKASSASAQQSPAEQAISLAIVGIIATFIAYKASGVFSFVAGFVAFGVIAYFALGLLSLVGGKVKSKHPDDSAMYWAEKSRQIQAEHQALPDLPQPQKPASRRK